jgi:hypothetical protein
MSYLSCETRKRRLDDNCGNVENSIDEKRRKKSNEEQIAWKLENDEVTTCILNSWLNEDTERQLEVFVDEFSLESDSSSCADFDEESFQEYQSEVCDDRTSTVAAQSGCEVDYDDESEEEICAGTVPNMSKEECDFDTGSEFEYSEDEEAVECERRVLILDLDNTLIHCSRDLDGELEIKAPEACNETEETMQLHDLEAILNSASESIKDGVQHLYWIKASKINHVEEDHGVFVFKLRPGVIKFLKACSRMYELAICTMGTADYALCVKAMLERASSVEFTAGVLSREDFDVVGQKRFDTAWPEEGAIIVDDRKDVWSDYQRNLVQIHPFSFFCQPNAVAFDEGGLSLKRTLKLLEEVHQASTQDPSQDVRDILEVFS